MRRLTASALVVAIFISWPPWRAAVLADSRDPPVPPGEIGGGIPVAIIGAGVDYTQDAVASRLVRDGEGEIAGYDYIDDDRRPYARDPAAQDVAEIVLGEGQTTSLIPLRVNLDDMTSLSHALRHAGQSPAMIVFIQDMPKERGAVAALASASRYFSDRLFIIAASEEGRVLDQDWASGLRGIPNVLTVAAAGPNSEPIAGANSGPLTIDLATTGAPLKGEGSRPAGAPGASARSAAHIAALAARLRAVEPAIPSAAVKVRIQELAKLPAGANAIGTVYGVIERPERYFWLE